MNSGLNRLSLHAGVIGRNQMLLAMVAGWMLVWMSVYGIAAYRYIVVATDRQPDVLKAVVTISTPPEVLPSGDGIPLEFEANTQLPEGGVEFRIEAVEGGEWITVDPQKPISFTGGDPAFTVPVRRRPTHKPALVKLAVHPVKPEAVLTLPAEPLLVRILPRPEAARPPASIHLSVPEELIAGERQFDVRIVLANGPANESTRVILQVTPEDTEFVRPSRREVEVFPGKPPETLRFMVPEIPRAAQTIVLSAKSPEGKLHDQATLRLLPAAPPPPPPEPLPVIAFDSPPAVTANDQELRQTVSWTGSWTGNRETAPRRLRISHDGSSRLTPAFQELELTGPSATKTLTWKVVSHPLAMEERMTFQVSADRIAPVLPRQVALHPLLPAATGPRPLLVIIDTVLLDEDTAPWFAPLIRDVMQSRGESLRGGTAIVLRKTGVVERWTENTTFGDKASAHTGATAHDAIAQLAALLRQDAASMGPVIVLWANGFAPPAKPEIPYPVSWKRPLTVLWMNVRNASETGLFGLWDAGDDDDTFRIEFLSTPQTYLKDSLDDLLLAVPR